MTMTADRFPQFELPPGGNTTSAWSIADQIALGDMLQERGGYSEEQPHLDDQGPLARYQALYANAGHRALREGMTGIAAPTRYDGDMADADLAIEPPREPLALEAATPAAPEASEYPSFIESEPDHGYGTLFEDAQTRLWSLEGVAARTVGDGDLADIQERISRLDGEMDTFFMRPNHQNTEHPAYRQYIARQRAKAELAIARSLLGRTVDDDTHARLEALATRLEQKYARIHHAWETAKEAIRRDAGFPAPLEHSTPTIGGVAVGIDEERRAITATAAQPTDVRIPKAALRVPGLEIDTTRPAGSEVELRIVQPGQTDAGGLAALKGADFDEELVPGEDPILQELRGLETLERILSGLRSL